MLESTRPRSLSSREASDVINFLGGESTQTRSFYKNVVSSNLEDEITSLSQHLRDLNAKKQYKLQRQKKLSEDRASNVTNRFKVSSERLSTLYIALTDRLSQLDYLNRLNHLYLEHIYSRQEKRRVTMNQDYTKQMESKKKKFIRDKVEYFFTYLRSNEKKLIPTSSSSSSSSSEEDDQESFEERRRLRVLKKQRRKSKRMEKRKRMEFEGWNEHMFDFSVIPSKKERGRLKARVNHFFQPVIDEFVRRRTRFKRTHDRTLMSQIERMVTGERIMLEQHFSKEFLKDFRKKVHLLDFVNDLLGMDRTELDTLLTQSKETEFKTEIGIFDTEMIELRKEYQFLYWKYLRKLERFKSLRSECSKMLKSEMSKVSQVKKRVFEDVRGRYEYLSEKERETREVHDEKENELRELQRKIKGIKEKTDRNVKEVGSMRAINKELEEGKKQFQIELELLKSKYNLLTKEKELESSKTYIVEREQELKNYNNRLLGKLIYLNDLKQIYTRSIAIYYHKVPYEFTKNEEFFRKKLETLNESLSQSITNNISSLSFFRAIQHINRKVDDVMNEELRDKQKTKYVSKMRKKFYKTLNKTIEFNKHEKGKIKEIVRSTSQINWFLFSLMEVLDEPEKYENDQDLEENIQVLEIENTKKAFNIQRLISYHQNNRSNYVSTLATVILNNLKKEGDGNYESPFEHVIKNRFVVDDDLLTNPEKKIKRIQKFDRFRRNLILDRRLFKIRERKRRTIVKRVEKTLQDFLTKEE